MNNRIYFLDNIRFFSIILVVIIHLCSYMPNEANLLAQCLSYISLLAVPIFFMCDGFTTARRLSKGFSSVAFGGFFNSNLLRLLIPWLVFSVAYALFRYFAELAGLLSVHIVMGKNLYRIALDAYASVHSGQLYFLPALFLIRILSNFIFMARDLKRAILFFIFFWVYSVFCGDVVARVFNVPMGNEPVLHALWGAQYCYLGHVIYFLMKEVPRYAKALSLLLVGIIFIGSNGLAIKLMLPAAAFIFFFVWCNLDLRFVTSMGGKTIGIYLLHMPIILNLVVILLNKLHLAAGLNLVFGVALTVSISHLVYLFCRRFVWGRFLFGESQLTESRVKV